MKNSWLIWVFIIGVGVTVLIAFNYQGGREALPLSEIFPDDDNYPVDLEYEFVDEADETAQASPDMGVQIETKSAALMNPISNIKSAVETKPAVVVEKTQPVVKSEPEKLAKATDVRKNLTYIPPVSKEVELSKVPFTIQVASFKEKSRAETKLSEIEKKGYKGFIASKDLGERSLVPCVYRAV